MKTGFTLVALLGVALAGCVNFGEKANTPAVVYYVLTDTRDADPLRAKTNAESHAPATAARADAIKGPDLLGAVAREGSHVPTLLVLDTTAGGFYDTDQLVFSRTAGTRGQYQFARWTERPGKRFADLMRTRLGRHGAWNVSAAGGYVRGDLLLETEMVEFYHDATREPGQVRLVLRAELVDMKQRSLLGRRVFEQQVPIATYDAAGAAQASNVAVSRVLDDLTVWLASLE